MSGLPYSDFKFIEIAHWPTGQKWPSRNTVYSINGFIDHFNNLELGKNPSLYNYYRSIHRFDLNFRDHVHKTGSVEQYEGEHVLDACVIESDGKSFADAVKFIFSELLPIFADLGVDQKDLLIDPSGNKGFHVEIPAGLFKPSPHPKLYLIHKFFIDAIFAKLPKSYFSLIRDGGLGLIDPSTYQICRLLRLRGTKNVHKDGLEEPHRGFKVNLNGTLDSLKGNPELVYNLWKNPSQEALTYEYLSGEWYWSKKPNSRLQDLWQECQSRVDDQQKKRVFVPDSQKHPTKRKIRVGEIPDCIKALENMALAEPEKVKEQNLRNYITCAITTFYAAAGYSDAWVLAHAKGVMSNCLAPDFTLDEIETAVKTKLAGDNTGAKYALGCGRESGFPACLHRFCSDSGELKDCPTHKAKTEKQTSNLVSLKDAVDQAAAEIDLGPSPYFFGIPELDTFYGPLQENDKTYIQAVQSSGKTLFTIGLFDNFAKVAKQQKDVLLFLAPEDKPKKTGRRWLITKAAMTLKQLYEAGSKNIPTSTFDWFKQYEEELYLWQVDKHSVSEISNAIDSAQQITGRKVAIVCYDGVTFLRAENRNAKILEADIAQELARVVASKDYVRSIFNVHMPKSVTQEAKKEGKAETGMRGGLNGAYGTMMYSATAQLLLSLWQDQGFIMVAPEKAKERWDGNLNVGPEICLAIDRFFRWHTLEQAVELVNQGHHAWFESDVKATYNLREQRKRMKKNNFKLSEIE